MRVCARGEMCEPYLFRALERLELSPWKPKHLVFTLLPRRKHPCARVARVHTFTTLRVTRGSVVWTGMLRRYLSCGPSGRRTTSSCNARDSSRIQTSTNACGECAEQPQGKRAGGDSLRTENSHGPGDHQGLPQNSVIIRVLLYRAVPQLSPPIPTAPPTRHAHIQARQDTPVHWSQRDPGHCTRRAPVKRHHTAALLLLARTRTTRTGFPSPAHAHAQPLP